MISKANLERQLKKLNKLYNLSLSAGSDPDLQKYYARLAVLELGGWVEECMDDIAWRYPVKTRMTSGYYYNHVEETIRRNYGFDYENNFRKMMKNIIGVIMLKKIESKMNPVLMQALSSALSRLYPQRNAHAHRPIHRTTITAPSVCISLLVDLYAGFSEFEKHLKKLRLT